MHSLTFAFRGIILLLVLACSPQNAEAKNAYKVTLLSSSLEDKAEYHVPQATHPVGLVFNSHGRPIIANYDPGVGIFLESDGKKSKPVFNIPAKPTSIEYNAFKAFIIPGHSKRAKLLIAAEDGTIWAYNRSISKKNPIEVINRSDSGTVYRGITLGKKGKKHYLYATDFRNAKIDIFDSNFNFIKSFNDPTIPDGYAPFNIRNIDGLLFVTYAKQLQPEKITDEPGHGHGFVNIFNLKGELIRRLASKGALNSPWGIEEAPDNFGKWSNAILVGNHGDGKICLYVLETGSYLGHLHNRHSKAIAIKGLMALLFKPETKQTKFAHLYFTAKPDDENGVVGFIRPAKRQRMEGKM